MKQSAGAHRGVGDLGRSAVARDILGVLAEADAPMSAGEIWARLGERPGVVHWALISVKNTLATLAEKGAVTTTGTGGMSRRYKLAGVLTK